jgi:hypothetical protein
VLRRQARRGRFVRQGEQILHVYFKCAGQPECDRGVGSEAAGLDGIDRLPADARGLGKPSCGESSLVAKRGQVVSDLQRDLLLHVRLSVRGPAVLAAGR